MIEKLNAVLHKCDDPEFEPTLDDLRRLVDFWEGYPQYLCDWTDLCNALEEASAYTPGSALAVGIRGLGCSSAELFFDGDSSDRICLKVLNSATPELPPDLFEGQSAQPQQEWANCGLDSIEHQDVVLRVFGERETTWQVLFSKGRYLASADLTATLHSLQCVHQRVEKVLQRMLAAKAFQASDLVTSRVVCYRFCDRLRQLAEYQVFSGTDKRKWPNDALNWQDFASKAEIAAVCNAQSALAQLLVAWKAGQPLQTNPIEHGKAADELGPKQDGPELPNKFYYQGKEVDFGGAKLEFKMLSALWQAKDKTLTGDELSSKLTDNLSDPVEPSHTQKRLNKRLSKSGIGLTISCVDERYTLEKLGNCNQA